jgi:hypothetical protein
MTTLSKSTMIPQHATHYRHSILRRSCLALIHVLWFAGILEAQVQFPWFPDSGLVVTYKQAAVKNVLATVNPRVFFGYWSVCADGQGFGYGNTYPSLDGHQLTDALLWLGQADVVEANWNYVRSFQRQDGLLPLAILPSFAGKMIGPDSMQSCVDQNGGLYRHWVPGNPLEATASITYIQNADVIFRYTLDTLWLEKQLPSINLAADYLDSLTTNNGAVRGCGYYVERPTRIESDGVTQCYAVDALRRVAALNRKMRFREREQRYDRLADRIQLHFTSVFWVGDHFGEYIHPQRGLISNHGLTDVDWAAIATGIATVEQQSILWPKLKDENRFHYGGMPTGIATLPETYETWEFTTPDRHDLAAMGRAWYLEAWARSCMGDAAGLLDGLRKVSQVGRENGYSWHERYQPDGKGGIHAAGPDTYCEYPANFIRIVQRFVLGVDLRLDGSVVIAPVVAREFWQKGFGQTLTWRGRSLQYGMTIDSVGGSYAGSSSQRIGVRLTPHPGSTGIRASIEGRPVPAEQVDGLTFITLPASQRKGSCRFKIVRY